MLIAYNDIKTHEEDQTQINMYKALGASVK